MRLIFAPFLILFGYGVAVAIATAVALALFMGIALVFNDQGGMAEFWRNMPGMYSVGFMMTFAYALPGFLLVLVLAWRLGWSGWATFAVAGAADAVLALLLSEIRGGGMLTPVMVLSCVPAGYAGGASYWTSAGRFLHFPRNLATN